ncbi:Uncharacterised protein [uncultured archaeon]|nr:Uncharacterised protein [uncultured archaeon]
MGANLKGWALVEEVLGPEVTRRLRSGQPFDIAASNGQIYRIQQGHGLVNLTRMERYCAHPDGKYNFPDTVIIWYDYITLKPDALEKVVGGQMDGHRFMLRPEDIEHPPGDNWIAYNNHEPEEPVHDIPASLPNAGTLTLNGAVTMTNGIMPVRNNVVDRLRAYPAPYEIAAMVAQRGMIAGSNMEEVMHNIPPGFREMYQSLLVTMTNLIAKGDLTIERGISDDGRERIECERQDEESYQAYQDGEDASFA